MTRRDVAALVVRMAVEKPQWGYTRIRGALSNLGHEIARTTVKRILHDHGIDPAPERSRRLPWKTFLQAHWEGLTACDLFTVEVLTLAGLPRDLVFFVIALQSRRVTIAGIPPQPYGTWMEQMARNVTDPVDGCLRRARYLMHDRDPLYTRGFGEILEGASVIKCCYAATGMYMTAAAAILRELASVSTSLSDETRLRRDTKMSRRVSRRVASPACIAGVRVSRKVRLIGRPLMRPLDCRN